MVTHGDGGSFGAQWTDCQAKAVPTATSADRRGSAFQMGGSVEVMSVPVWYASGAEQPLALR
ncbi:hypothetical protein D0Q02_05435 [Micromonospora craniellae]|uniref:Uncharacterized protein n=1 Tax=Micromonospora craniellae TaxID=2294034 RepID=A0A372G3G9_9ACTN|nr:hypothetical protein D0Q02_05435 [Micromonospora craniellae]